MDENIIKLVVIFKDGSHITTYCASIEYFKSRNGFVINYYDNENNYDDMFISLDNIKDLWSFYGKPNN